MSGNPFGEPVGNPFGEPVEESLGNPFDNFSVAISLLYMAAQSGKTQKTINIIQNKIQNYIDGFWDKPKVFTIWFSSNSKAINSQTFDRLKKTNANCIQWDTDNHHEINDLFEKILKNNIDYLCCCTNKIRINKIKKLINKINNDDSYKMKIIIVIDEADDTIKLTKSFCNNFCANISKIECVIPVTASGIEKIINSSPEKKINIFKRNTSVPAPDKYLSLNEFKPTFTSSSSSTINILEDFPEIIKKGNIIFAPGSKFQKDHEAIKDYLLLRNVAVFIVNGKKKQLIKPNLVNRPIELIETNIEKNMLVKPLGDRIRELCVDHELNTYDGIAIIGQTCVGRGITFQHPEFRITHSILPNIKNKEQAYQVASRVIGNVKHFENFEKAKIYCSKKLWFNILEQEIIVKNLCLLNKPINNELIEITTSDVKELNNSKTKIFKTFPSEVLARNFVNNDLTLPSDKKMQKRKSGYDNAPERFKNYIEKRCKTLEEIKKNPYLRERENWWSAGELNDGSWVVYWDTRHFPHVII